MIRYIIAELDGEPAGFVRVSFRPEFRRDLHVAWLGIAVRRKYWRRGVGTGLMKEAINLAKESGFRKLMLGTIEGNERAIPHACQEIKYNYDNKGGTFAFFIADLNKVQRTRSIHSNLGSSKHACMLPRLGLLQS